MIFEKAMFVVSCELGEIITSLATSIAIVSYVMAGGLLSFAHHNSTVHLKCKCSSW